MSQKNDRNVISGNSSVSVSKLESTSNVLNLDLIKSLLKHINIRAYLEETFRDEIKSFLCKLIGNSAEDYDDDEPLSLYGLDSLSVIELLDYVGVKIDDIDIETMSINTIVEFFT